MRARAFSRGRPLEVAGKRREKTQCPGTWFQAPAPLPSPSQNSAPTLSSGRRAERRGRALAGDRPSFEGALKEFLQDLDVKGRAAPWVLELERTLKESH